MPQKIRADQSRTRYGHGGPIQVVALDPAGKSALTASLRVLYRWAVHRKTDKALRKGIVWLLLSSLGPRLSQWDVPP